LVWEENLTNTSKNLPKAYTYICRRPTAQLTSLVEVNHNEDNFPVNRDKVWTHASLNYFGQNFIIEKVTGFCFTKTRNVLTTVPCHQPVWLLLSAVLSCLPNPVVLNLFWPIFSQKYPMDRFAMLTLHEQPGP